MASSPKIILTEVDQSSYAVTTSNTILAVVGYATKGPIGSAVLTTSRKEFIDKYGPPPVNAPWSSLATYRAFNQGNQILFYRVAETSGSNEAVAAEHVIRNSTPAIAGYQTFTQTTPVAYGSYDAKEVYDFKLTVNGGTQREVFITSPITSDWTLDNVKTQINTQITSNTSGFQEWSTKTAPTIPTAAEYRFIASLNGTPLATGEFSVNLAPSDPLATIATKVTTAIAGGTRGYQRWTKSSITGITELGIAADTYNFKVNGGSDLVVTVPSPMTYTALVAAMQALAPTVLITFDTNTGSGSIRAQALADGANATLADGATDGLFTALAGTVDGAVVSEAGAASGYTVVVNAATGRIRITSSATGASSAISITTPTSPAPGFSHSLSTLLSGTLAANNGAASVAATCVLNTAGKVKVISDTTGVGSIVAIVAGTNANNKRLNTLLGLDTATAGANEILPSANDNILFRAKEKGSATNNITITKSTRTNPVDSSTVYKIEIYYNSELKETFDDISLTIADTNFFATIINADPTNGGSEWIEIEYVDNPVNGALTYADGTIQLGVGTDEYQPGDDTIDDYDYRVGTDGIPISGGSSLFVTALASTSDLANAEIFDYHILITPDNDSEATQNAAIQLAESEARQDFIYVADPPFGLTYSEAADWHNGVGSHGRNTAANTSYASTYWPWLKDVNPNNGEYVWCPPSVFVGEKYMEVDRSYAPWLAPAGDKRGKLVAYDYETSPSQAQRDLLYGDFNAVNPIVNFTTKGLEIYGEKTLLRENSALNRIHVRRMVIYIKKLIKKAMQSIIFEPHNADSWTRATNMINSILEPVRQGGGLDNYKVVIDSTTNTPDVIAQSIMKGIIKLVPVGVIEIIDLKIKIYASGATITD